MTALDEAAGLHRRVHTSHPAEYPVFGTKPLEQDGWHDATITGRQTFVAITAPEFTRYFFDHALVTSPGLGSCNNIPVWNGGPILGTANLLAKAMQFNPARVSAHEAQVTDTRSALCCALSQALPG